MWNVDGRTTDGRRRTKSDGNSSIIQNLCWKSNLVLLNADLFVLCQSRMVKFTYHAIYNISNLTIFGSKPAGPGNFLLALTGVCNGLSALGLLWCCLVWLTGSLFLGTIICCDTAGTLDVEWIGLSNSISLLPWQYLLCCCCWLWLKFVQFFDFIIAPGNAELILKSILWKENNSMYRYIINMIKFNIIIHIWLSNLIEFHFPKSLNKLLWIFV